jgi:hypothetical protein
VQAPSNRDELVIMTGALHLVCPPRKPQIRVVASLHGGVPPRAASPRAIQ